MRETHHRMKNTLTLLGASVRREFARGKSTELSAAVDRFEGRIVAFGRLYQLLSHDGDHLPRGADSSTISVAEYFEDLCAALSKAILEPAGIACEAAIGSGSLQAGPCTQLALMVTELVTNAAKHAFPDLATGAIRIELENREGVWCCTVADNGIGPSGALQGVGSRILEGLARTLNARMYANGGRTGTTVRIMMPAPALALAAKQQRNGDRHRA
jgi:two-component sensor histidine kinase